MGKKTDAALRSFEAELLRPPGIGTWTYLTVPFSAAEAYGVKGRIPIRATVNGVAYRSSLLPKGDGTHYLVVGGKIRDEVGATQGDVVKVVLELDLEERVVDVPPELARLLKRRPKARTAFAKLAYSHQKRYADHIQEAKSPETRGRRAEKAVQALEGELLG